MKAASVRKQLTAGGRRKNLQEVRAGVLHRGYRQNESQLSSLETRAAGGATTEMRGQSKV